jgi:hypothetical protein
MSTILVGNGRSLIGSRLGKKIDKFDTVIRMNNFVTEGFETDVGTKFDIHARRSCDDVKYIPDDNVHVYGFITACDISYGMSVVSRNLLYSYGDRYTEVTLEKCKEIADQVGLKYPQERASVGVLSVAYFVEKFEDITITGFDLIQNPDTPTFKKYWSAPPVDAHYHNFFKEARFLEDLIQKKVISVLD